MNYLNIMFKFGLVNFNTKPLIAYQKNPYFLHLAFDKDVEFLDFYCLNDFEGNIGVPYESNYFSGMFYDFMTSKPYDNTFRIYKTKNNSKSLFNVSEIEAVTIDPSNIDHIQMYKIWRLRNDTHPIPALEIFIRKPFKKIDLVTPITDEWKEIIFKAYFTHTIVKNGLRTIQLNADTKRKAIEYLSKSMSSPASYYYRAACYNGWMDPFPKLDDNGKLLHGLEADRQLYNYNNEETPGVLKKGYYSPNFEKIFPN